MKNTTSGFTLIELLIVIAIIGILAAVLIPNLLGARQRAYDAAAQSCAKGIATALETYQIDSNTYSGVDRTYVVANGGNACTSSNTTISISGLPTTGVSTYTVTASHVQGKATYTVTPAGITK